MPYPLDVPGIDAEITSLGALTGVTVTSCAHTTSGGKTVRFLRVTGGPPLATRAVVGITAGIHAREWAPPDAVLSFVRNLLTHYTAGTGIRYPRYRHAGPPVKVYEPFVISFPQVKRIVEKLDLFVMPCVNPDGREFTQSVGGDLMWRKNRNPMVGGTIGCDINRNCDIAWDIEKYYSETFETGPNCSATKDPAHPTKFDLYIGPSVASEAETQNVQSFIVDHAIKYYIDVHSAAHMIGWAWALEDDGTDPAQTWRNAAFDRTPAAPGGLGGRDGSGTTYKEFFPNTGSLHLLRRHQIMARSARDQIRVNAGSDAGARAQATYLAQQLPGIGYYSPGSSVDFAVSRQFLPGPPPPPAAAFGMVIESGSRDVAIDGGFQPTTAQFPKIEREIHAALAQILDLAAMWG